MKDIQIDGTPIDRSGSGEQSENAASGDGGHGQGHERTGTAESMAHNMEFGRGKPEHANER